MQAQGVEATLRGRVTDSAGLAVPGVKIEVTNTGTNQVTPTVTDSVGLYTTPFLNPGTYRITAVAAGFKKFLREGLSLSVGDTVAVDMMLEVGAVTEQLTVTAEAPLLETAKADRGTLVDERTVEEMPLNGRNPFMLAKIAAGVNFNGTVIYQRPFDNGAIAQWTINGGLYPAMNSCSTARPITPRPAVTISPMCLRWTPCRSSRFRPILTTRSTAIPAAASSTCRSRAAPIPCTERPTNLPAAKPGTPIPSRTMRVGAPKGEHYLDQYGGQIGGPVYIPKVYDGRNKTFFMFDYERYRENTPRPYTLSVPAPEFSTGDFSKLVNGAGQPITIYDPATGKDVNGTWVAAAFPRQHDPGQPHQPDRQEHPQLFPAAQYHTPGQGYSQSNQFFDAPDKDSFYNQVLKFDQQIGSKHHFSVRQIRSNRLEMGWDGSNSVTGVGQSGSLPEVRTNDGTESRMGRDPFASNGVQRPRLLQPVSWRGSRRCQRRVSTLPNWAFPTSLAAALPGGAFFGSI